MEMFQVDVYCVSKEGNKYKRITSNKLNASRTNWNVEQIVMAMTEKNTAMKRTQTKKNNYRSQ